MFPTKWFVNVCLVFDLQVKICCIMLQQILHPKITLTLHMCITLIFYHMYYAIFKSKSLDE